MKTYREVNRKIVNQDAGQISLEHNFYLNDQEIGVRMYDNMLHSDMEGKADFVVIAEEKHEYILMHKGYHVQNLILRKFFENGALLDFMEFAG